MCIPTISTVKPQNAAKDKQPSDNYNRHTKPKNVVLIMNMTSKIKSLSELCIICGHKGSPKNEKLHKLHQTYMNFFLQLNTKEDILKNVNNQTVDGPH